MAEEPRYQGAGEDSALHERCLIDKTGDRIIMDYLIRRREISEDERLAALGYFCADYERSYGNAAFYLEMAKGVGPSGQSQRDCLRRAESLTMRAALDAKRIMTIESDLDDRMPDLHRESDFDALQGLRKQMYFVEEFPGCYIQLIALQRQIEKAVGREDYESAAGFRDKMRAIASGAQPR